MPPLHPFGWLRRVAQSSTTAAARSLGAAWPMSISPSSRAKAASCARALRRIAQKRQQCAGKRLRRTGALQEFGHHVLAQHQIGQDHARHLDEGVGDRPPPAARPCRPRPSARRQPPVPASRCRTSSAPRARCGRPRPWPPARSRYAPARATVRVAAATASASRGTAGTTTSSAPARSANSATASPNTASQAADFAGAAARQHQQQRRIGQSALRFLGVRTQSRDLLAQRMADKGARRSAQPLHAPSGSNGSSAST